MDVYSPEEVREASVERTAAGAAPPKPVTVMLMVLLMLLFLPLGPLVHQWDVGRCWLVDGFAIDGWRSERAPKRLLRVVPERVPRVSARYFHVESLLTLDTSTSSSG